MTVQHTLLAYAQSFASFLLDSKLGSSLSKIIVFGSVARGDCTEESDIDIFIDTNPANETQILKLLSLFRTSQVAQNWTLKGVKNELSVKVGNLREWKLRREVISSGIVLYGKYNDVSEEAQYYLLIQIQTLKGKSTNKQMQIFRKLYGYKQKVAKKEYVTKGLLKEQEGIRLGRGVFIVPMESRRPILEFLKAKKIPYRVYELWSDAFT